MRPTTVAASERDRCSVGAGGAAAGVEARADAARAHAQLRDGRALGVARRERDHGDLAAHRRMHAAAIGEAARLREPMGEGEAGRMRDRRRRLAGIGVEALRLAGIRRDRVVAARGRATSTPRCRRPPPASPRGAGSHRPPGPRWVRGPGCPRRGRGERHERGAECDGGRQAAHRVRDAWPSRPSSRGCSTRGRCRRDRRRTSRPACRDRADSAAPTSAPSGTRSRAGDPVVGRPLRHDPAAGPVGGGRRDGARRARRGGHDREPRRRWLGHAGEVTGGTGATRRSRIAFPTVEPSRNIGAGR